MPRDFFGRDIESAVVFERNGVEISRLERPPDTFALGDADAHGRAIRRIVGQSPEIAPELGFRICSLGRRRRGRPGGFCRLIDLSGACRGD